MATLKDVSAEARKIKQSKAYINAPYEKQKEINELVKGLISSAAKKEAASFNDGQSKLVADEEAQIQQSQADMGDAMSLPERAIGVAATAPARLGTGLARAASLGLQLIPGETGEGAAKNLSQWAQNTEEGLNVISPPVPLDFSSFGSTMKTIGLSAIQMAPLMLATGGLSNALQGTRLAAAMPQTGILSKIINPATVSSAAIMAAPTLQEAASTKDELGKTVLPKYPAAVAAMVPFYALTEQMGAITPGAVGKLLRGGIGYISRPIMDTMKSIYAKTGFSAAASYLAKRVFRTATPIFMEGAEEAIQGVQEIATKHFANNKPEEASAKTIEELSNPDTWWNLFQQFVIGSSVGAAFSSIGSLSQKERSAATKHQPSAGQQNTGPSSNSGSQQQQNSQQQNKQQGSQGQQSKQNQQNQQQNQQRQNQQQQNKPSGKNRVDRDLIEKMMKFARATDMNNFDAMVAEIKKLQAEARQRGDHSQEKVIDGGLVNLHLWRQKQKAQQSQQSTQQSTQQQSTQQQAPSQPNYQQPFNQAPQTPPQAPQQTQTQPTIIPQQSVNVQQQNPLQNAAPTIQPGASRFTPEMAAAVTQKAPVDVTAPEPESVDSDQLIEDIKRNRQLSIAALQDRQNGVITQSEYHAATKDLRNKKAALFAKYDNQKPVVTQEKVKPNAPKAVLLTPAPDKTPDREPMKVTGKLSPSASIEKKLVQEKTEPTKPTSAAVDVRDLPAFELPEHHKNDETAKRLVTATDKVVDLNMDVKRGTIKKIMPPSAKYIGGAVVIKENDSFVGNKRIPGKREIVGFPFLLGRLKRGESKLFNRDGLPEEAAKPVIISTKTGESARVSSTAEKKEALSLDLAKAKDYEFRHKPGDKVAFKDALGNQKDYMISSAYIENGEPRYIVYPPGKKESLGYHVWVAEKDSISPAKNATKPTVKIISTGMDAEAFTPRGRTLNVKFAAIPVGDLITSSNSDFPAELQPRDRKKVDSTRQIETIAANPIVDKLITAFVGADVGTPIVVEIDGKLIVLSGNGRTEAMAKGYKDGTMKEYQKTLTTKAGEFALKDIPQNQPVLVRVLKGKYSPEDLRALSVDLNSEDKLAFSAGEKAGSDATAVIKHAPLIVSNDLYSHLNKNFISRVFGDITSKNDEGRYFGADNQLNKEGEYRLESAVFSAAYNNPRLSSMFAEDSDPTIKNIFNALRDVGVQTAQVNGMVTLGSLNDLSLGNAMSEAALQLDSLRKTGTTIAGYFAQGQLFDDGVSAMAKDILVQMDKYKASAKKLVELFSDYNNAVIKLGDPRQKNMLGDQPVIPTRAELFKAVSERMNDRYEKTKQPDLFSNPSPSSRPTEIAPVAQGIPATKAAVAAKEIKSADLQDKTEKLPAAVLGKPPVFNLKNPVEIADLLGLKSFSHAKPMSEAHAQKMLKVLNDMAAKMGIPLKALGLNGTLTLMFKNQGDLIGGYGPVTKSIIMSNKIDEAAIVHEWAHALDAYLYSNPLKPMRSTSEMGMANAVYDGFARKEIVDAMKEFRAAAIKSEWYARSLRQKAPRGESDYWYKPREMFARASEQYMADRINETGKYLAESQRYSLEGRLMQQAERHTKKYKSLPTDATLESYAKEIALTFSYMLPGEKKVLYPLLKKVFDALKIEKTPGGFKLYSEAFPGARIVSEYGEQIAKWGYSFFKAGLNKFSNWAKAMLRSLGKIAIKTLKDIFSSLQEFSKKLGKRGAITIPNILSAEQKAKLNTLKESFIANVQDRMRPIQVVQNEVAPKGLPENIDPFMLSKLYPGRLEAKQDQFEADYWKPLVDIIKENKIKYDEANLYLYARTAPERNKQIAKVNQKFNNTNKPGSGMSNKRAAKILNMFRKNGKLPALAKVGAQVDKITKRLNDLRIEYSLNSRSQIATWNATYDYYVPLKGLSNKATQEFKGQGFEVSGKDKRAAGRKSRAKDILSYLQQDSEFVIMKGEKNRVAMAFVGMANFYPRPSIYRIYFDKQKPTFAKNGQVVYRTNFMDKFKFEVFHAKMNGVDVAIEIRKPELLQAMKLWDQESTSVAVRALNLVNRLDMMVNTALNPEFIIKNWVIDIQTAVIGASVEESFAIGKEIFTGIPQALKDITDFRNGKKTPGAQMFQEYKLDGGKTGFFRMSSFERRAKELKELIDAGDPGVIQKALQKGGDLIGWIKDMNEIAEMLTRYSGYKTVRSHGTSRNKSAYFALNATVDFTTKGSWGAALNAAWVFAGSRIQGVARNLSFAKSMAASGRGKKIALALVLLGFMNDILNRILSPIDPDDEENLYDKQEVNDKAVNLYIPTGGIAGIPFFKIPMSRAFGVLPEIGRNLAATMFGPQTKMESAKGIINAIINVGNILGPDERGMFYSFMPSLFKKFLDIETGTKWTGSPTRPTPNPFGGQDPDSERFFESTPSYMVDAARFLNWLSGGSKNRPGGIDISPSTIQYLAEGFGGGMAKTIGRGADTAIRLATDKEVSIRNIPFARLFVGDTSSDNTSRIFRENFDTITQFEKEMKDRKGDKSYVKANPWLRQMISRAENAKEIITRIRDRNIDEDVKRKKIAVVKKKFNKKFKELKARQVKK